MIQPVQSNNPRSQVENTKKVQPENKGLSLSRASLVCFLALLQFSGYYVKQSRTASSNCCSARIPANNISTIITSWLVSSLKVAKLVKQLCSLSPPVSYAVHSQNFHCTFLACIFTKQKSNQTTEMHKTSPLVQETLLLFCTVSDTG